MDALALVKSVIRIITMVSLIMLGYTVGEYHGYDLGVSSMGDIAGPSLYRCINLLGNKFGSVK